MTIQAGIIGDGYTSAELNRLLARHPYVQVAGVTSIENIGRKLQEVYPHLSGYSRIFCEELVKPDFFDRCDVVIFALPHGVAAPLAREALLRNTKVVDLGADFRFRQRERYEQWYQHTHPAPELLTEAVYGLPELYAERIVESRLIANPGCYPTSAILALAPALQHELIDPATIIVDSKSGASGAGRTPSFTNIFCEVNENVRAYGIASHRHTPEIEQVLSWIAGKELVVSFTPHLIPMSRGILSTTYGQLRRKVSGQEVWEIYTDFYKGKYFVTVLELGQLPQTKAVYSSNHCHIGVVVDERTGRLVAVAAIDNLVKGASGQAIQNLNLMFGLPEESGLDFPGVMP